MNKDELKVLADEYYSKHNCAQAVVLTMADYFDMKKRYPGARFRTVWRRALRHTRIRMRCRKRRSYVSGDL